MIRLRNAALLLGLFLGTLTGCAATLQSSALPQGVAVRTLAKVDAGGAFAVNRSGVVAAVSQGNLQIIPPTGGPGRSIAPAPATDLEFAPDGTRLAAVFATPDKSLLQLFDLEGKILAETMVTGRITSIAWRSEHELLATALQMKKYSFGTELISLLYRWDTVAAPVATTLNDMTVKPRTAKLPEATLNQSVKMALSPYGDEIAYSSLKEPPLFKTYLSVALRHLDSGASRVVAEVDLGSGGPLYTPDGETLLIGDSQALTRRLSLPEGKEINAWPVAGDHIACSPSGSYMLLHGHLYQGGQEVAWFPRESTGVFLPDGSGLAISCEGTLFLVAGLNDPKPPPPADLGRILELRRLRSLGLITDKEFKARKAKGPGL